MKKRLAIYVHHDSKGEVRDYIIYCLKGLQEVVSDILFVVNGSITPEGRKKIEALGVKILVRENEGFDWWAWKAGIEYFGYEKVAEYDELLLTNNTYYGPIYPFSEMWAEMDKKDCDFWGINKHPEVESYWIPNDKSSKTLEHIQSYWLVFKQRILRSYDFENYWKTLKPHRSFKEMVGYGETKLTKYFENCGFKSAVFMDTEKYYKLIYDNPCFLTDKQVIEDRCPIVKRKFLIGFKEHILPFCSDYVTRRILSYLEKNKLYNTDLIWQDLLAFQPLSVLNNTLHLNYILPTQLEAKNTAAKIAVIMYIYPLDLINYCRQYAENIPEYIDIVIVNTDKQVQTECQKAFAGLPNKIEYRLQPNRGRDNTALLVTCRDIIEKYEYICFLHSKKSPQNKNLIHGEFFREHNFLSLLASKEYVTNVINLFQKNKFLGILCPLIPNAGNYSFLLNDQWTCNYQNAERFLKEKLKLNITPENELIGPFGGMYWARTKALKTLISYHWKFEDFPEEPLPVTDGLLTHVLERIVTLLAKHDGFYSACVAPDFYAEAYLNNTLYRYKKLLQSSSSIAGNASVSFSTLTGVKKTRYKLFNFIPLWSYRIKGGRTVYKFCGIPFWKVRKMANNITTKYYFCGIPLLKVSKK